MIFVISLQNWSVKYCILRDKQLIFIFLLIISNTLSEKVHIGIHCYLLPFRGGKLKKKYCLFFALCAQYCCIQHQYIFITMRTILLYSASINLLALCAQTVFIVNIFVNQKRGNCFTVSDIYFLFHNSILESTKQNWTKGNWFQGTDNHNVKS